MRISGWRIDGFGVLADHHVQDLPAGLVVVTGRNEAGKSTLLDFLRFTLFGYPRLRAQQRPPLRGGRHGGQVLLADGGKDYTVTRHRGQREPSVTVDGEETGGESELRRLLGAVDATLFNNVFAFGLTELQTFESLDTEGVRDRIFTAGVLGAGRSARAAQQQLDAQRAELLRPRARDTEIRRLEHRLRDAQEALTEARSRAQAHEPAREREAELRAGMDELAQTAAAARTDIAAATSLLELWPRQTRMVQAQQELDALDDVGTVPTDGLARLEQAVASVTAAREHCEQAEASVSEIDRRLADCPRDEPVEQAAAEVVALYEGLSAYRSDAQRHDELARTIAEQSNGLSEGLASLGPGWDRDRLATFDASIPALDEARGLGSRVATASQQVEDARQRLERFDPGPPRAVPALWRRGSWLLAGLGAVAGAAASGGPSIGSAGRSWGLAAALALVAAALVFVVRDRSLRGVVDRCERERDQHVAALEAARRQLAEDEATWRGWQDAHGVPAGLSPDATADFLSSLTRLRTEDHRLVATEHEAGLLDARITEFTERATRCLEEIGTPSDDLVAGIRLLHDRLTRAMAARARREELQTDRQLAHDRVRAARDAHDRARRALDDLLGEVGAADEQEFRDRMAVAARRDELARAVDDGRTQIRDRLGDGEAAAALERELAGGDVTAWQERRDRARQSLDEAERAREDAVRQHQDVSRQLADLESSADVAACALDWESARTELARAVRRWQRLTIAGGLLDETLRRFERERQPEVMARASTLFATVTEGRYTKVLAAEGSVDVLDANGSRQPGQTLSRGTAEQLYLCLRFALATEFARHAVALPLVLDDVLVNFDPRRARGMAEVIADVAERQQVVAFTCHPHMVHLLSGSTDAFVVDLG